MYRKLFFIFFVSIGISSLAQVRPGELRGVIYDKATGETLPMANIVVSISGINLLEAFMSLKDHTDREIRWQVVIHIVFVSSGVLLALMDYIASKTKSKM